MKLEDWVHEFIRKLPRNYCGNVVLAFERPGELTAIHRNDVWTKDLFYNRFKEAGRLSEGENDGHKSDASNPTIS